MPVPLYTSQFIFLWINFYLFVSPPEKRREEKKEPFINITNGTGNKILSHFKWLPIFYENAMIRYLSVPFFILLFVYIYLCFIPRQLLFIKNSQHECSQFFSAIPLFLIKSFESSSLQNYPRFKFNRKVIFLCSPFLPSLLGSSQYWFYLIIHATLKKKMCYVQQHFPNWHPRPGKLFLVCGNQSSQ